MDGRVIANALETQGYVRNNSNIVVSSKTYDYVTIDGIEEIKQRLDKLEKKYETPQLFYSWEGRITEINNRRNSFGY